MPKAREKLLQLDDKIGRMGKISNNLERHGDDWVTGFTIPISGIMLTEPELNRFMADKFCHRAWFVTKGSVDSPAEWWGEERFAVSTPYEAMKLSVRVSGDETLDFEGEEADEEDDDCEDKPACKITSITLKPVQGGETEMRFSLYLRPGIGKPNLLLQEHQHREIRLTIAEAKAKAKPEAPQAQLPLGGQNGAAAEPSAETAH